MLCQVFKDNFVVGAEKEDETVLPPEDTPDNAEDEQSKETEDIQEQEVKLVFTVYRTKPAPH